MKKGSVAFLAGLLALSVGGVATASALIVSGTHVQPQSGTTDQVLYLNWGETENLSQISNLTPSSPAYRTISVAAPQKSANAPDGKFTAALAADPDQREDVTKTASIAGVTVTIYNAPYQESGAPGEGATLIGTLTEGSLTASRVVNAAETYYLKITISSEAYAAYIAAAATDELAAKITFTYGVDE